MWWRILGLLTAGEVCLAIHLPSINEAKVGNLSDHKVGGGRKGVQVLGQQAAFLDLSKQARGRIHSGAHGAGHAAETAEAKQHAHKGGKKRRRHAPEGGDVALASEEGERLLVAARRKTLGSAAAADLHSKASSASPRRQGGNSSTTSSRSSSPKEKVEVVDVDMDSGSRPQKDASDHKEDRSHLEQDFENLPGLAAKALKTILHKDDAGNESSKMTPAEALQLQSGKPGNKTKDDPMMDDPLMNTTTAAPLPVADTGSIEPSWLPHINMPDWSKWIPSAPSFPKHKTLPWACETKACKMTRLGMAAGLVAAVMSFVCCLNCLLT